MNYIVDFVKSTTYSLSILTIPKYHDEWIECFHEDTQKKVQTNFSLRLYVQKKNEYLIVQSMH